MNIIELEGVHPKMQADQDSSISKSNEPSAVDETKTRTKTNLAYCDFDIMSAYHARKKPRQNKTKHTKEHARDAKEHSRASRSERLEKSDLSRKIEDLTARNEKIRQMLINSVNLDESEMKQTNQRDVVADVKSRSHREHKSRKATHLSHELSSHKDDRTKSTTEKSHKSVIQKTSEIQEERDNIRQRVRRDRNSINSEKDPEPCNRQGRNVVKVKNNATKSNIKEEKRKDKSNESISSIKKEEVANNVVESKSQLVRVTNYPQKSPPSGRQDDKQLNKTEVITVYENNHILEETDSIMSKSKDTLKNALKSKTCARQPSYTPDGNYFDYEVVLPVPQQRQIKTESKPNEESINVSHCQCQQNTATAVTPRKELSFSNLNLRPNIYHYTNGWKMATTQTSVSRIQTPGYGTIGLAVHSYQLDDPPPTPAEDPCKVKCKPGVVSQATIALRDIMKVHELEQQQQQNNGQKNKFPEHIPLPDLTPKPPLKSALSRNSKFHKTRCDTSERIVEVASKNCRDQKVTFTVEGVEPPKRLHKFDENSKALKVEHVFNLQVFPGTTVNPNEQKTDDKKQIELNVTNHTIRPETIKECNQSVDNFNSSGNFYPFVLTRSECKPKSKESCEVSYKFRKKSWSNKELPKKKHKEKKKSDKKARVIKHDVGVQTRREDTEEHIKSERHVGVSTTRCYSQEAQVQVSLLPELPSFSSGLQIPHTRPHCNSQSDTSITTYKEQFIVKTDFPVYRVCEQTTPKPSVTEVLKMDEKLESLTSTEVSHRALALKPQPTRKQRPYQRSRKCCRICSPRGYDDLPNPRLCHPVMSTGSIREVPSVMKKTRSKSLTHDRESLAEKININKETIKHHHQEIEALEKCLNEILERLGKEDSLSKTAVYGDKSSTANAKAFKFERSGLPSLDSFDISMGSNYIHINEKAKYQSQMNPKSKLKITMSKFHRGKAYGERLRKRHRKIKEKQKELVENRNVLIPVKVRSVYKNTKGFISSATSLSSKLSDFGSSSPYPQSIASLNIGYPVKIEDSVLTVPSKYYARKHRTQKGIVKKKHKLYPKAYSKKKNVSIYDLLMKYINLTNDQSSDDIENSSHSKSEQKIVLSPDESQARIVVLSVSSVKLMPSPKQKMEPFFIAKTTLPKQVHPQTDETSTDSLENKTRTQQKPNLCPLTAIFNFQPPKTDYLVYNTEVFSPNKPKIEVKPSPPGTSTSDAPGPGNQLMTIVEESLPVSNEVSSQLPNNACKEEVTEARIADLSPILSRRVYSSYVDCIKSLVKLNKIPITPKLTTFNCNEKECGNLIFNYTSKKDAKETKEKQELKEQSTCERHDSSAYHTMTTFLDSQSGSMRSPSETDTVMTKNESGYESSKKSCSFKNFFKRHTLLDVFKSKSKKKSLDCHTTTSESLTMPVICTPACIISEESMVGVSAMEYEEEQYKSPFNQNKHVLWFNFRKKKREAGFGCDPWCKNRTDPSNPSEVPEICAETCHKSIQCLSSGKRDNLKTKCPCTMPFEEQKEQCKKYASKVLMEAAERKQGYLRQYNQFEEMPLNVLMGTKKCPCEEMKQSCVMTYANKMAGIKKKQPVVSEVTQVKPRQVSEPIQTPSAEKRPIADIPVEVIKASPSEVKRPEIVTPHIPPKLSDARLMQLPAPAMPDNETTLRPEEKSVDRVSDGIRTYTDKEIFDRLLRNFDRKNSIAERLSTDEIFYRDQIDAANSGMVPHLQVQSTPDQVFVPERTRGPRFNDRPTPLVQVTNANTKVSPDDIGTCFARGFRPDNLMLSGDACFHINKQDKVKLSPYMLKNTESIIDFSERETPLDFLLALGFMVDEASNALKDDDIRSRLQAAITEARVWINKITTTQGTLLYLVAYKSRPETMRYFLQLVEAIINKRITNAIRLDGFLRVLEDVEAGRLQMINILGEDKFEDEENEEKIVKKQLKNLFVTVYNVAEKEAAVNGHSVSQDQVALLRVLVAKYRAGLHPHLELIARYIGQELLNNEIQLEAAMIFLSRLDTAEVKLKEFENYCGISCQLQENG